MFSQIHALRDALMNMSSSSFPFNEPSIHGRILDITLRMAPYESSELLRLQRILLITTSSIQRFQRLLRVMKPDFYGLRLLIQTNTQSNAPIPYILNFDFTLCMNDTIEFSFSNDFIGIAAALYYAYKHPGICICICIVLEMTRPSFPYPVTLDSFPFVSSRQRSGLWEMGRFARWREDERWVG
jgi:hypothetical protein